MFSDQCVPCSTGTFVLENPSKSSTEKFVFFVSIHVKRSELLLLATFFFNCYFALYDLVSFSIGVKWDMRNMK